MAQYLAECLKQAGLRIDPVKCITAANKIALLENFKRSMTEKRIVLQPGSGSLKKNFLPDYWLELIGRLNSGSAFIEQVLDTAKFFIQNK